MKRRIVSLCIIFAVCSCLVVLAYTQMDNIVGVLYSFKYSDKEIENKINENTKTYADGVAEILGHPIRDITEEEQKQINDGTATKEEIIEKIILEELEKASNIPVENNKGSETEGDKGKISGNSSNNNKDTYTGTARKEESVSSKKESPNNSSAGDEQNTPSEKEIKESESQSGNSSYYMAQLYSLKGKYIGLLDGMVASAIAEYEALSENERTNSKKLAIGSSYAGKASGLESQCDGEVNSILKSLEAELKAEGKSTGVISTIKDAYSNEKRLKRAYYLNMFK